MNSELRIMNYFLGNGYDLYNCCSRINRLLCIIKSPFNIKDPELRTQHSELTIQNSKILDTTIAGPGCLYKNLFLSN